MLTKQLATCMYKMLWLKFSKGDGYLQGTSVELVPQAKCTAMKTASSQVICSSY